MKRNETKWNKKRNRKRNTKIERQTAHTQGGQSEASVGASPFERWQHAAHYKKEKQAKKMAKISTAKKEKKS